MLDIVQRLNFLLILSKLFFCFGVISSTFNHESTRNVPRVLLISFDGFRAKYLDEHYLENFNAFIADGMSARTITQFSTLTFPNHFSMVTGLSQERHGIIGNSIYDRQLNQSFDMSCCNENEQWWHQNPRTLPIWQANQQASISRKSGAIGFVGSLSPFCGMYVHKTIPYSGSNTFQYIVDTMVNWFKDEHDPVNFISMYFNEPDKSGHAYGPDSKEICATLAECDDLLGYIKAQLQSNKLWDDTNIVIATDHGMTATDPKERSMVLDHYIDRSRCLHIKSALSIVNIYSPDIYTTMQLYQNLSNIPHFDVYLRETVPDEYQYGRNYRVGDVVISPHSGYVVYDTEESRNSSTLAGTHGYNNTGEDMLGILLARGPDVQRLDAPPLQRTLKLVDVYPFLTELLKIPRRSEIDGSYDRIQEFLK